ncbi:L,D-transpeptidase family protein [Phyllobacterium sp. 0TCS1.6C]|uniref:L,D-transpeptidase family protein n=1 Tax=unclassified Phyllobacterium TaxID=2638441 RepID=UPI002264DAD7|nr:MULTISPECIES: L,D-transpeptidase family protein [unclassified Phyllobacterium]MCX8279405.1 L,D-transpeptidase family protein [Phyllobacterium sp. 0TCS1.6C]MCX8292404.1 L,D-transpeptidase family protein [Phyllobacterium sp. 0TCS1.6A]
MNTRLSKRAVFIAALMSATAFSAQPSLAASNLMELLFPSRRIEAQPVMPANPPSKRTAAPARSQPVRAPIKRVTVTAPTNYDYKPETLVAVDFSKVDPQLTASAHPVSMAPTMEADRFGLKIDHLKEAQVQAEKRVADALLSFYATNQKPIWTSSYDVTPQAKAVVAQLTRAGEAGLDPLDYSVKLPGDAYDRSDIPGRLKLLAEFELQLSARALRYALDQSEGRINPNRLSGFHDLATEKVEPRAILEQLAEAKDPTAVLASFEPRNKWYAELKQRLHEIADTGQPSVTIAPGTLIRPGQSSPELPKLMALLREKAPKAYLEQHDLVLQQHQSSEIYDESLVQAIKDYQLSQGRRADGIIGSATIKALVGESSQSKRDRILYSMERLRWMPHEFGERYVFINQPAYRAQYFSGGTEKLAMNVVIGSPRNQTYFFNDTIETVVFNPSWGVPRSIILNEMMPKILSNPSYLERSGYEVYDRSGRVVPSSSVNWSKVAASGGGVGIRQKPSLDNALGELKILFPNSHDIYMHDTPAKSYFKRDMRALSHGCIRLENPRGMAAAVLELSVDELKPYFGKNERNVKVKSQLPVYVSYFTAWPDATTGEINYYDDVYERDAYLQKAIAKTTALRQADMLQTANL